MPHLLAVVSPKGGVGKTTTAIHLGAALALSGQRVLVLDLSPSGDASAGLGFPKEDVHRGTAELMFGHCDVARAAVCTHVRGLELVPASPALVGAEVELSGYPYREVRLREALRAAVPAYDTIILDTPGALGLLTVNALVAATGVILPLPGEFFAMSALRDALLAVRAVQRGLNRHLTRAGVLLTMTDRRSRVSVEVASQARALFGAEVFDTEIPRDLGLVEAASYGRTLLTHDPSARAAEAYRVLARELHSRRDAAIWHEPARVAS